MHDAGECGLNDPVPCSLNPHFNHEEHEGEIRRSRRGAKGRGQVSILNIPFQIGTSYLFNVET